MRKTKAADGCQSVVNNGKMDFHKLILHFYLCLGSMKSFVCCTQLKTHLRGKCCQNNFPNPIFIFFVTTKIFSTLKINQIPHPHIYNTNLLFLLFFSCADFMQVCMCHMHIAQEINYAKRYSSMGATETVVEVQLWCGK